MSGPKEDYGPRGDASRHLPLAALEAAVRALPPGLKDAGRLRLIIRRHADGSREMLASAILTPQEGVPGDRWGRHPAPNPRTQLAVMRFDIAEVIANGQPLTLFGDNLFVDLDLTAAGLPPGARLKVGQAVLEVSPEPHNGCLKFKGRFGADALRFVQAEPTRELNLRGVYWTVVEAGQVYAGAPIERL